VTAGLQLLHASVEERVRSIAAGRDWPCRRGCDACCRRLAEAPRATEAEWDLVGQAMAELPEAVRREVAERIHALPPTGPVACPFLYPAAGSCLVYSARPLACRTYGFYVERDLGQYCGEITARVERGELADVVWGNAIALEAAQRELGELIGLRAWFDGLATLGR
jgi:uncharacterized protein